MSFTFGTSRSFAGRLHAIGAKIAAMAVVPLCAVLALQVLPASATSTSDPFLPGTFGYDASYPQCPGFSVSPGASFAIIGFSHGRPFTDNTCAQALWEGATNAIGSGATVAGYISTGYSGAYAKDIDTACSKASLGVALSSGGTPHQISQNQQAWAIGCSEADFAMAYALSLGIWPAMWWADVETGNSWSTNTTLNDWTIIGITQEFWSPVDTNVTSVPVANHLPAEGGVPVGIYSYHAAWNSITTGSGFAPTSADATWLGAAPSGSTCLSTSSFDTLPMWVLQVGTTFGGGDPDTAC